MLKRLPYRLMESVSRFGNRFNKVVPEARPAESLYSRMYLDKINIRLSHVFPSGSALKILDGGCGAGATAIPLASAGHDVTGIEVHKSSIELAQANAAAAGVNIQVIQDDLLKALKSIPKDSFDVAICLGVLYTCADFKEIIGEFSRVLKKSGVFFVSLRTPNYFISTLMRQKQYDKALYAAKNSEGVLRVATAPTYYNWQTPSEAEALLQSSGFEVIGMEPHGLFTGAGDDGLAAIADVHDIPDEVLHSTIYELEMQERPDCTGAARFMLATGSKR